MLYRRGDDNHAIRVTEYQIARLDPHAAADDGDVDLRGSAATLGVERCDAPVKHRESQLPYRANVACKAVGHATGGASRTGRGRKKLAPWCDSSRGATREDWHIVGMQVIDEGNLELTDSPRGDVKMS